MGTHKTQVQPASTKALSGAAPEKRKLEPEQQLGPSRAQRMETSQLPSTGTSPVAQAETLSGAASGESGAIGRARMFNASQRDMGNARIGTLLGTDQDRSTAREEVSLPGGLPVVNKVPGPAADAWSSSQQGDAASLPAEPEEEAAVETAGAAPIPEAGPTSSAPEGDIESGADIGAGAPAPSSPEAAATPPEAAATPPEAAATPPEAAATPPEVAATPPEVAATPPEVAATPPEAAPEPAEGPAPALAEGAAGAGETLATPSGLLAGDGLGEATAPSGRPSAGITGPGGGVEMADARDTGTLPPPPPPSPRPLVMPVDVGDPLKGPLSQFQAMVRNQDERLTRAIGDEQARVAEDGAASKRRAEEGIGSQLATVSSRVRAKGGELAALRRSKKAQIEALRRKRVHETDEAYKARLKSVRAVYLSRQIEAINIGVTRSTEMSGHGEAAAQRVEKTGATNASCAEQIGEDKARQYSGGKRAGDIAKMARAAAADTAKTIREETLATAKAIHKQSGRLSAEILKGAIKSSGELGKTQKDTEASLKAARDKAVEGIGRQAEQAVPVVDRIIDQALGQVAAQHTGFIRQMSRIASGIIRAVELSVNKAQTAIAQSGQERLDDLRDAEAAVMDSAEGKEQDPRGALADSLSGLHPEFSGSVAASVAELHGGTGQMTGRIDAGAQVAIVAALALGGTAMGGLANLSRAVMKGLGDALTKLDQEAGKLVEKAKDTLGKIQTGVEDKLKEAITKIKTDLGSLVLKGKGEVDKMARETLSPQESQLRTLSANIDKKAKELQSEGWLKRGLKAVGRFLWNALSFIGGLIWGILKAVFKFIVGLLVLILVLAAALLVLFVALAALFLVLTILFGYAIASLVVMTVLAIVLSVLALAVIAFLVYGLVMMVYGIVMNIYRAITDDTLSWFERGTLVGEAVGDILLLLLPFKGKIKARLPKWWPKWLGGKGKTPKPSQPSPIIDPSTGRPVGEAPAPRPIIDPRTGRPVGEAPAPRPIIDPRTGRPVGEAPAPRPIIDPRTGRPVGDGPRPPTRAPREPSRVTPEPPSLWGIFKAQFHEEFRFRLRRFRGNDKMEPDPGLRGGEGQLFRSQLHPLQALKRWFEKRLADMPRSIQLLVDVRSAVEANPTLRSVIDVVRIRERGSDWVIRDFSPDSVPLRSALGDAAAATARASAIAELQAMRGRGELSAVLLNLLKKLNKEPPSANLHWDPGSGKIIVIDMQ